MRKVLIFLVLLWLFLLTATPAFADIDVGLINGSFETAGTSNVPAGWKAKFTASDGRVCNQAMDGTCSVHIVGGKSAKKIKQDLVVSGAAGTPLRLTFSTMDSNVPGSGKWQATLKVWYNDGKKETIKLDIVPSGDTWTERSINLTTAKGYKKIRVEFLYSRKSGEMWLDNVDLVIVEAGPPPDPEADTEQFLTDNFDVQDTYGRVLCVFDGANNCPAQITTKAFCFDDPCTKPDTLYPITQDYESIQLASNASQAGDLIIIMPGTHDGVNVDTMGGADGAYIHFMGWGNPGDVVVNTSPGFPNDNFYFIDTHHYIISNIEFQDANRAGIFFSGFFSDTGHFSHHMIVSDVYSHDNGTWGMHTTATNYIVIQDSTFTNSGDEHGAYVSGSGDHMLIRRNVFQDNNASGLQANADPVTATYELFAWMDSQGGTCGLDPDTDTWHEVKACYDSQGMPDLGENIEDGIHNGLIIEQNVMTGNGSIGGAAINMASVRNSVIRNNLVYGNEAGGIACWDDDYANGKGLPGKSPFGCQNDLIVNNTIVDNPGSRTALALINGATDMQVFNNIVVRNRSDAYEISNFSADGLESGHNYYFDLEISPNSTGWTLLDTDAGSGSITGFDLADALDNFVNGVFTPWVLDSGAWPTLNPARPDYHLVTGSTLISSGDASVGPVLDFDGHTRVGTEIGAFSEEP
jgi:hypothetical protein